MPRDWNQATMTRWIFRSTLHVPNPVSMLVVTAGIIAMVATSPKKGKL